MRPQVIELDAAGDGVVMVDRLQANFKVGLQVDVGGGASYIVYTTADAKDGFADVAAYVAGALWTAVPDLGEVGTPATVDAVGNVFFPVQAVRFQASAVTDPLNPPALTLIQAHD